jgi:RNase P subunit RPR2
MKKYCKNKAVLKFFPGHYFNFWRYGHKRNDCRNSNKAWINQGYPDKKTTCYRCNTIGHIARNYRSQNPNKPQASIKCFNCGIYGHTVKYCRYNKTSRNERSSSGIEGIITKNLQEHQMEFNLTFIK